MKLDYTITPEAMKEGASIAYKTRMLKKNLLIFGALCIFFNITIFEESSIFSATISLLLCAVLLFLQRFIYLTRTSKLAFKGKPLEIECSLEITEEGFSMKSPTTDSKVSWAHFVEATISPKGALIYSSKNIFNFIPATATITDGTWEEFTELLESKIEKKI